MASAGLVDAMHDLIVLGGGMAGLSTARAAALSGLSVLVVERGTVCGQGATAAAKQGHVFVPDEHPAQPAAKRLDLSEAFRYRSLHVYKQANATGLDLGLRMGGAARPMCAPALSSA